MKRAIGSLGILVALASASCGGSPPPAEAASPAPSVGEQVIPLTGTRQITITDDGKACTAVGECWSGFCADGFCCDAACTGACRVCNLAVSPGTCTNFPAGVADPDAAQECPGGTCGAACDGSGACAAAPAVGAGCGQCSAVWTEVLAQDDAGMGRPAGVKMAGLAYDEPRGRIVKFGGYGAAGTADDLVQYGETWTYDGTAWTQVTPVDPEADGNPNARAFMGLEFDARNGVVLLVDGGWSSTETRDDVWAWNGASWQRLYADNPSPWWEDWMDYSVEPTNRADHWIAYDRLGGATWMFGGGTRTNDYASPWPSWMAVPDPFWKWDGAAWSRIDAAGPSARQSLRMAYAGAGHIALFGGTSGGDETWEWDGAAWTDRTAASAVRPADRIHHGLVWVAHRRTLVLFGGVGPGGQYGDTWEIDPGAWTWTEITPATSPRRRHEHAMAYDSARRVVVLYGGFTRPDDDVYYRGRNDSWELAFVPNPCP